MAFSIIALISKRKLLPLILALFSIVLALFLLVLVVLSRQTIYRGIFVENEDVSGMSKIQALTHVSNVTDEKYRGMHISLKYMDKEWKIALDDINFRHELSDAIEKAYKIGREGSILYRLKQVINTRVNPIHIKANIEFDRSKLENLLKSIKKEIDREEKDASIIYENDSIVFESEVVGRLMDIDTNMKLMENCIKQEIFDGIDIIVAEKRPRILYEDIKEINGVLARFSTVFNPGDLNRTHNIKLACERIKGTILLENDIFSMNRALGPRTIENGYKEAPVIYKNELVKGPGGGICQVTTTLYGAVLRGRLDVIERTHHSMPLGYVEPGQDATIAEGSIDFKFQNKLAFNGENYPLCIWAEVDKNKINISLLGKKNEDGFIVKLNSEIVEEYIPEEEIIVDENVPEGEKIVVQEARKGLKVIVYREIYSKDGILLGKEKISEDVYKALNGRVKVNPAYFEAMMTASDMETENDIETETEIEKESNMEIESDIEIESDTEGGGGVHIDENW